MTIIFQDIFTDTASILLTAHAPDIDTPGNGWGNDSGASWRIHTTGTQAYHSSGQNNAHIVTNSGISDGIVRLTVINPTTSSTVAQRDVGMVVRWSSNANYWKVAFNSVLGVFRITEINGGVLTVRATTSYTPVAGDVIEVTLSGDTITATVNGGNQIQYTSTFNQTATYHGMCGRDATDVFDNFEIDDGASGGVSGTLDVTLSGATLAATGGVPVNTLVTWIELQIPEASFGYTGTLTVTLDGATVSGIGNLPLTGALSTTLDGASLSATATSGQTTYVSDTFADTNGVVLPSHTPDTDSVGGGWLAFGASADLQIQSGKAEARSATNGDWLGNVIETNQSDVEIQADITLVNAAVTYPSAIILRYVDGSNYLRANFIPSSNTFYLEDVVAGSPSIVKPTPYLSATGFPGLPVSTSAGMTITAKVIAQGTSVTLVLGERKLTYKNVTDHQSGTKHGLLGGNRTSGANSTRFDNFSVKSFVSPATEAPVTWFHADHGVYNLDGSLASLVTDRPVLWLDKSGHGHSAVNHIAAEQAKYDPTGYNGMPAVQFGMAASQNLQYAVPAAKTGGITVFALMRIPAYTPSSAHHDPFRLTTVGPTTVGPGGNDDDRMAAMLYDADDLLHLTFMEDANTYDYTSTLTADDEWHLVAWTIDFAGGTSEIRVDKTTVNTKTALPAPDDDYMWGSIGSALLGAYAIESYFREFRVYDTPMTAGQMAVIEDEMVSNLGTLSVTLDGATLSGTGSAAVNGSASISLDGSTLAGNASVPVSGSLSAQLDSATLTASGAVSVTGSLSVTLDGGVLASNASAPILGTLGEALDGAVLAGTGSVEDRGSLAVTLDGADLSASASAPVEGSLSVSLDGGSLAASASVLVAGSASISLEDGALAGTGSAGVRGSLAVTLSGATLSAEAFSQAGGHLSVTLDGASLSATASVSVAGVLSSALDGAALVGTGSVSVSGALGITLDGASLASTGTVSDPPITGSLTATLDGATLSAIGVVSITGTLDETLDGASLSSLGEVGVQGQTGITLAGATLAGVGEVGVTGSLSVTLDGAVLAASATYGAQPRTGTLDVTLAGASLVSQASVSISGAASITLSGAVIYARGRGPVVDPIVTYQNTFVITDTQSVTMSISDVIIYEVKLQ